MQDDPVVVYTPLLGTNHDNNFRAEAIDRRGADGMSCRAFGNRVRRVGCQMVSRAAPAKASVLFALSRIFLRFELFEDREGLIRLDSITFARKLAPQGQPGLA